MQENEQLERTDTTFQNPQRSEQETELIKNPTNTNSQDPSPRAEELYETM